MADQQALQVSRFQLSSVVVPGVCHHTHGSGDQIQAAMFVASILPTKSSPQPDPLPLKLANQVYNGQVIQKENLVIAVQEISLGSMLWPSHLDLSKSCPSY